MQCSVHYCLKDIDIRGSHFVASLSAAALATVFVSANIDDGLELRARHVLKAAQAPSFAIARSNSAKSTLFEVDSYTNSTTPAFAKMFALSSRDPNEQQLSNPSATEKQAANGVENEQGITEQRNPLFQQMDDGKDGYVNTGLAARNGRQGVQPELNG